MIEVRKVKVAVEEVHHEGGPPLDAPLVVATAAAIVANPFAGRYEPDLMAFMAELRGLGTDLAERLVPLLGGVGNVEAYGKGAIVGEDGELEHGALWHEAGGWAMRSVLGDPKAIVPGVKTVAGIGQRLIVPLGHVHAAYVRSHFGTAELTIWDGPRRAEILYGLAMASGGRPHARIGGLAAADVVGDNGLR
jgi:Amino acid synthesis